MPQNLLRMTGITKHFPGVLAVDDVALEIMPGEVHGLLGENGAGKSTLLKILSGAEQPDAGTIEFGGREVVLSTPIDAQQCGIVTIYQEFNLIPTMTIAENMFLGREPGRGPVISWKRMCEKTRELLDRLGLSLNPMRLVGELSVAEQQMVEIARALSMESRLIVMDEPTSALTDQEVERLFAIIEDLSSRGLSIIFVTHRLEEVMRICDRVTVLRDGRRVGGGDVGKLTIDDIIRLMVGRSIAQFFTPLTPRTPGRLVLKVEGLQRTGNAVDPSASVLTDINLEVRAGEILGLAGLVGSGRTNVARCIFGADGMDAGRIQIDGTVVQINSPVDAIRHGIGLVPEDRKLQALFLDLAVRPNLAIASLGKLLRGYFVSDRAESELVERYRKSLNIRMASPEQRIADLSGGNQQKVVLARWLALQPRVLIVDEPTRGIDVGAKSEVHQQLDAMARAGIAIIAISSELPEILAISDRIVTMREGCVTGSVMRAEASEELLMQMMTIEVSRPDLADAA
jgi:inositol transport system ATP-binding protein